MGYLSLSAEAMPVFARRGFPTFSRKVSPHPFQKALGNRRKCRCIEPSSPWDISPFQPKLCRYLPVGASRLFREKLPPHHFKKALGNRRKCRCIEPLSPWDISPFQLKLCRYTELREGPVAYCDRTKFGIHMKQYRGLAVYCPDLFPHFGHLPLRHYKLEIQPLLPHKLLVGAHLSDSTLIKHHKSACVTES